MRRVEGRLKGKVASNQREKNRNELRNYIVFDIFSSSSTQCSTWKMNGTLGNYATLAGVNYSFNFSSPDASTWITFPKQKKQTQQF